MVTRGLSERRALAVVRMTDFCAGSELKTNPALGPQA